jgi:ribose-phosphate pyrophosphokinase
MTPLVLHLPDDHAFAAKMASSLRTEASALVLHRFPDGESLVRLDTDVAGRDVVMVASFCRPDEKTLALLFAADTARDLGASRVLLAAPYLAYLRQDKRFHPGEAVTSRSFASLLSSAFNGIVTVDPHLHRYRALGEIYRVPARTVHAAPSIAAWIKGHVERPLLVGPDAESAQWVEEVARGVDAPFVVLAKTRHADRDVEVSLPEARHWLDRQAVLLDDIISSAATMIEAVHSARRAGLAAPWCIGVHALFAAGAYEALLAAGPRAVLTCDTVAHVSNAISVADSVATAVAQLLEDTSRG